MIFYQAKRNILPNSPNDYYREQTQMLIDDRWDNTTTLHNIEEEFPFGTMMFRNVEARMVHALDKSTNKKQGDDYRELIFQDIDYNAKLGNYYRFNNAYWLTVNLDELNRTSKNIIVHRCNNVLKWKDSSGALYSYPCFLAYDVTAASPRVDNNVITPNNRIIVTVQANENTLGLKVNHRFIFGDRPFKIIGYNNYMIDTIDGKQSIMYIQTQLDEISPYDDFEKGIAYNTYIIDETPEEVEGKNGIVVEPPFDFVKQNYIMEFTANLYIDNEIQSDVIEAETLGAPTWSYEFTSLGNNKFALKCKKVSQIPLEIRFTNGVETNSILVDLKSMF